MKNKINTFFLLLICACLAFCSCGAEISALENLCFALEDFDLDRAEKYVSDEEGYFSAVRELEATLTREKTEIAKEIYSFISFSEAEENEGVCTVTLTYVDMSGLIASANESLAAGATTATEYFRDMIDKGTLKNLFLKTERGVAVVLAEKNGKAAVPLGYASENADFTRLLGLDTFLRWYSLQS